MTQPLWEPETIGVTIAIGNSDDKLTQFEWSEFCETLRTGFPYLHVFGVWYSAPDSRYQNMCVSALIEAEYLDSLRLWLTDMAGVWWQDSIAITIGKAEFIEAKKP